MRDFVYFSASALALGVSAPAFAQEQQSATGTPEASTNAPGLGEIVVTAERRTSTTQKTAASISVRSGSQLLNQGRYSLRDVLEDVPGVSGGAAESSGTSFGSGSDNPAAGLTIRGIQSNLGAGGSSVSAAAAAALYVDDVYNGIGSDYDIDRVEVLRGPQGTLYGRSATSGVVAIHTAAPDLNDVAGLLSGEIGDYDLFHLSGAINVPIVSDKLAVRASGNFYQRDGFYSTRGGDRRETTDGRVKVLFKPTDNFSAMLGAALENNNTASAAVQISQPTPGHYSFIQDEAVPGWNDKRQYWGVFDLDLGGVAVTYVPAYRTYKQHAVNRVRGFQNIDQYIDTPKDDFLTQELRVRSNNDSALKWQAGLFYYRNELDDTNASYDADPVTGAIVGLGSLAVTHKTTDNIGAFAEGTYSFSPETRLTAGLRYDYTKVVSEQDYTSRSGITKSLTADEGTRKFNNVNYKVRLEHDITPTNLVYGSVSTGFSPGDVTVTQDENLQPKVLELKAQTLTAYELGSKNRFIGGKLQLNGAVYFYDYGGYQAANISTGTVIIPQPNGQPPIAVPIFSAVNVPVHAYGAELEILANPWHGGRLSGSIEYSESRYHDVPAGFESSFPFKRIEGVAPFRVNASFNQTVDLNDRTSLVLGGTVRYYSSYNASTTATQATIDAGYAEWLRNPARAIADINATLNLADGKVSLTGYIRNVADVKYKLTSNVLLVPGAATTAVTLSAPRTFGAVLTTRF